jgi:hypothetical protein
MEFPRLKKIAAGIVIASMPTLAAGCSGYSTYVVRMPEGVTDCERACAVLMTPPEGSNSYITSVDACAYGTYVRDGAEREQVAVCRAVVTGPGGRRPAGWREPQLARSSEIAAWLARMAHLEAASVPAFAQLERELRAHEAPFDLIEDARRAQVDEARHARIMSAWCILQGGAVPPLELDETPLRSIEEMAIDNASEGCAGETFGALVGLHQSFAARDPRFRSDMAQIAEDELAHAHLSMRVDAWARSRLSERARRRVHEARNAAFDALEMDETSEATRRVLGLPGEETATRIKRAASDQIFA